MERGHAVVPAADGTLPFLVSAGVMSFDAGHVGNQRMALSLASMCALSLFREDVRRESLTDVWRAILTEEINWNAPVRGVPPIQSCCLNPSPALSRYGD